MGIRTSDIDCYIQVPDYVDKNKSLVLIARNILRNYPRIFQNLFAIVNAKVPIVKLYHAPTKRNCDINFKSIAGVRNSKLLAYLLQLDTRALNLAIIIKYWSKVHVFTGTNLMPNYALTLLVIFYLQQEKILPPIYLLQMNVPPLIADNWNTAFDDKTPYMTFNNKPLYQLLGGFFKYYNNFHFSESVISLYEGTVLSKKEFENLDNLTDIYHLYKVNVRAGLDKLRTDSAICVQDPFELNKNCTVAVYPKLVQRIIECIKMSSNAYENESSNNFLKATLKRDLRNESQIKPKNMHPYKPNTSNLSKIMKNSKRGFKANQFKNKAVKNHLTMVYEQLKRKQSKNVENR